MSQLLPSQKVQNLIDFVSRLPGKGSKSSNPRTFSTSNDDLEDEKSSPLFNSPLGDKFYLTTAINYTNGRPHIGHAYEAITSDIISRYHRIYGRDVFFLTGTDEHGQKVANTAIKAGLTPIQLCDQNVEIFKRLNVELNISQDYYIRTTEDKHLKFASEMFQKSYDNGDIYLSNYEGWYNEREEHFVPDNEAKLNDYKDPKTGWEYTKQKEEAYFFRMSKYQDRLISFYKENPFAIQPEKSYNHILQRLSEPLIDLCVSRSSFDWGVPLPINNKHVIYVWFDALSNYLSGINYFDKIDNLNLKRFWPCDVHIIGKDIVWFHCVIWPCILMSCNIPLYKCVYCHGFVSDKDGEKMSKSIGNVIDPFDLLKNYKSDSIRYFIAHEAHYGDDLKFNIKKFEYIHDAILTKCYGNLVNRVLTLSFQYFNKSEIPDIDTSDLLEQFKSGYQNYNTKKNEIFDFNKFRNEIERDMYFFRIQEISESIHDKLEYCNKFLTQLEPWNKKKVNQNDRIKILKFFLELIYLFTHYQSPYTPTACEKTFEYIGQSPMNIKDLSEKFDNLKVGTKISKGDLLFKQFISKHETKAKNALQPSIAHVEFVVGKILSVKQHPNADKCYIEEIDIGEPKPRQIVSGLVPHCKPSDLDGSLVIIFKNLKKSKIRGEISEGMLLAAGTVDKSKVVPLRPPQSCNVGERILWKKEDITSWEPDANLNISKKNSIWHEISPLLKTNDKGEMSFDGHIFTTLKGESITAELPNAQIS